MKSVLSGNVGEDAKKTTLMEGDRKIIKIGENSCLKSRKANEVKLNFCMEVMENHVLTSSISYKSIKGSIM